MVESVVLDNSLSVSVTRISEYYFTHFQTLLSNLKRYFFCVTLFITFGEKVVSIKER